MKTVRSSSAYALIIGGFVAGVATVVGMSGGFKPEVAIGKTVSMGRLVGNTSKEEATTLHNLNNSLVSLSEFVKPAVVHIRSVTSRASDGTGKMVPISGSEGAGFIYRKDGYVITNDHVVSGANEVTVVTNDGKEYKGSVKRAPEWDVAIVKIEGKEFPTLGIADTKGVLPGQMVMAIGSPYGLENSVTFGHVSAIKRENAVQDSSNSGGPAERFYPDLIQTDAAINVGNSGGPLVNIDGQVIGMNSSIYSKTGGSNGIAFAIPGNEVRFIADILIQKGKITRSQIGVFPRDLKPYEKTEKKLSGGAYVLDVAPGGPADKVGIKKGDIISKVGDLPIEGQIDLRNSMLVLAPKSQTKIEFLRDGKQNSATVTLEEAKPLKTQSNPKLMPFNGKDGDIFGSPDLKDLQEKLKQQITPNDLGQGNDPEVAPLKGSKPKLGIAIENLTPEIRKNNNIPSNCHGVFVGKLDTGSIAARNGINSGDVIEFLGTKKVETVDDLASEMAHLNWGDRVKIKIRRFTNGSEMSIEKDISLK
jgi:serine protease Do